MNAAISSLLSSTVPPVPRTGLVRSAPSIPAPAPDVVSPGVASGSEPRADELILSPQALRAADETEIARGHSDEALTEEEHRQVEELEKRDREVRAHEQAHKSAAGSLGGAISYEFTTGPDGVRYVTGGEVPIDTTPVRDDPQATIRKMQQVRRAALAPADPSSADRRVASLASQQEREAQADLRAESKASADEANASGAAGTSDASDSPDASDGADDTTSIPPPARSDTAARAVSAYAGTSKPSTPSVDLRA